MVGVSATLLCAAQFLLSSGATAATGKPPTNIKKAKQQAHQTSKPSPKPSTKPSQKSSTKPTRSGAEILAQSPDGHWRGLNPDNTPC